MTERPLIYNKLVRDLIPERIAASGKSFTSSVLSNPDFAEALRHKLIEEGHELFHAGTRGEIINESADLLELLDSIIKHHGIDWDEVISKQATKREESGGFSKRSVGCGERVNCINPHCTRLPDSMMWFVPHHILQGASLTEAAV